MFIGLFVICIIVGIIVFLTNDVRIHSKLAGSSIMAFGALFLILSMVRLVGPGEAGIQVLFGKVKKEVLPSGLHFVNPVVTLVKMSVRTQAYTMSKRRGEGQIRGDDAIVALSADGLTIQMDVTVWFHLDQNRAAEVYREIGLDYIGKIVRPAIRTAIRQAAVKYTATAIYAASREKVTNDIFNILESDFQKRGITCEKVLLRNVELPDKVKSAINDKIAAEQDAQKMKYVIQKEQQEANRKRIEAEGIAKAQKIISHSLTTPYLQWYYIQTLKALVNSPNNTIIVTPFDQKLTPLIQIPSGKR